MATEVQYRNEGVLRLENILAEYTAENLGITANGDYAEITGNFNNGDIIHITEPETLTGDYVVTQFDGNLDVGFKFLFGLNAEDLDGVITPIKGYKIDLLPACWVQDYDLNMGSWNTEEIKNGCGKTITLSNAFERGEATFSFIENWNIDLQLAIKQRFQQKAPALVVAFEPFAQDDTGNKALLGLQEHYRAIVTSIEFNRPNDSYSTGSLTLKVSSDIETARIA